MTDVNPAEIEHFVRATLGCGCPDEVFRSIAINRLPAAAGRPPIVQLLVGSRLLIHVVDPPAREPTNGWIEQLAANGRAARDRHGYNRFRLVIASATPLAATRELTDRFARSITGDDKAHLHFVEPGALPGGLKLQPTSGLP